MEVVNVPAAGGWSRFIANGGVYCGRSRVLGCRFILGVHGDRRRVLRLHREWLWHELTGGNRTVQLYLGRLPPDATLGCFWRWPTCPCHTIAAAWRWWAQQGHRRYGSFRPYP